METKISVIFRGKKTKVHDPNLLTIYLRTTINGERFEVCTNRTVEKHKWSIESGMVKGKTEEAKSVNQFLDVLKQRVFDYQKMLLREGKPFSKETLRAKWFGLDENPPTLLEVFKDHNKHLEELIGKDCSKATFGKYRTTMDHVVAFLNWKYKKKDIELAKLTYSFIVDFEFWLKSVKNCNHNTSIKYISNLRKIVNICFKSGWLVRDPFFGFKMSKKEVIREILTEEELARLISKEFSNARIRQVRDIFIFSCFTGLAYVDAKKLKRNEIITGVDGEKWIATRRKKTDSPTRIPLLPNVLELVEKYKDHPVCVRENSLLPIPSNAKLNAYLKEVADLCGITKNLTFHTARHTFATTVTLNNGIPIESVSKMLGHKSIKITQIYAKIVDKKLAEDMRTLRDKFSANFGSK